MMQLGNWAREYILFLFYFISFAQTVIRNNGKQ